MADSRSFQCSPDSSSSVRYKNPVLIFFFFLLVSCEAHLVMWASPLAVCLLSAPVTHSLIKPCDGQGPVFMGLTEQRLCFFRGSWKHWEKPWWEAQKEQVQHGVVILLDSSRCPSILNALILNTLPPLHPRFAECNEMDSGLSKGSSMYRGCILLQPVLG